MQDTRKIVEVFWTDAASYDGHTLKGIVHKITPVKRKNIGYVIKDTGTELTVVSGELDNGCYDHPLVIPKRCVEKIIEISKLNTIEIIL